MRNKTEIEENVWKIRTIKEGREEDNIAETM
jgi:hypothetical protein